MSVRLGDRPERAKVSDTEGFSFEAFKGLGEFCTICAFEFKQRVSQSASREVRLRTDRTSYYKTLTILRFAKKEQDAGRMFAVDYESAIRLRSYLNASFADTTSATIFSRYRNIAVFAFDNGYVKAFHLPKGVSYGHALRKTTTRTLADLVPNDFVRGKTHAELNSVLLKQLVSFCWKLILENHPKVMRGQEIQRAKKVVTVDDVVTCCRSDPSREALLDTLTAHLWYSHNGIISKRNYVNRIRVGNQFQHDSSANSAAIIKYVIVRSSVLHPSAPIVYDDVFEHLWPNTNYAAPFALLLNVAQVCPFAVETLNVDSLRPDPLEPKKFMTLFWEKPRSSAEKVTGLAIGGPQAKSLPRAWELLSEGTAAIRDIAPKQLKKRAFLVVKYGKAGASIAVYQAIDIKSFFRIAIQSERNPEYALLSSIASHIGGRLVRNTSMNVTRHRSDLETTASVAQHKRLATTEGYLRTPILKAAHEDEIASSQSLMYGWASGTYEVVRNSVDEAAAALDISLSKAKRLMEEEYNFGFGFSLVDQRTIVVDTTMNFIRMQQWRDKIAENELRLKSSNFRRWEEFWLPQIGLLDMALHDFSRRTKAEATRLQGRFLFPHPEPF